MYESNIGAHSLLSKLGICMRDGNTTPPPPPHPRSVRRVKGCNFSLVLICAEIRGNTSFSSFIPAKASYREISLLKSQKVPSVITGALLGSMIILVYNNMLSQKRVSFINNKRGEMHEGNGVINNKRGEIKGNGVITWRYITRASNRKATSTMNKIKLLRNILKWIRVDCG